MLEGKVLGQSKGEFYQIYDSYNKHQVDTNKLSRIIESLTYYDFLGLILLYRREQRKEWSTVYDIKGDKEKSDMLDMIIKRVSALSKEDKGLLEYYLSQTILKLSDFD